MSKQLYIKQISLVLVQFQCQNCITGTSPSDCLMSYQGHLLGALLPLCRVGIFYSSSRLGKRCIYICVCVCVSVCVCVHKYVCVYIYIYMCVCIYIYMCVCVCVYMCVCIYIYIYIEREREGWGINWFLYKKVVIFAPKIGSRICNRWICIFPYTDHIGAFTLVSKFRDADYNNSLTTKKLQNVKNRTFYPIRIIGISQTFLNRISTPS